MKLACAEYQFLLDLKENCVNCLIVENPHLFSLFVKDLWTEYNGGEGIFVLSEDNQPVALSKKAVVLVNPFAIDFQNKKIVSCLYRKLALSAIEINADKMAFLNTAFKMMDKIVFSGPDLPVDYEVDFEWNELFKFFGVKIDVKEFKLLERLIQYVKVLSVLCDIKVLILVNIKAYLKDKEIEELYRQSHYSKIQLILIEDYERYRMPEEKILIIDQDGCIIDLQDVL